MAIIQGNNRSNRLRGDAENDTITGFGGSDRLVGADGDDILYGDDQGGSPIFGFGDDTLIGGDGRDVLVGGAGDDELSGGGGDDVLFNGFANGVINGGGQLSYNFATVGDGGGDTLDGGRGFDSAFLLFDRAAGVSLDISDTDAVGVIRDGFAAIGTITGVERIEFFGGVGGDIVTGGGFDDKLFGRGGDDRLTGLGGGDRLEGGNGDDILDGGDGFDVASYETAQAGVTVDLRLIGQQQDTGGAGLDTLIAIEQVDGSAFSDMLIGGDGGDFFSDGAGGDDEIRCGAGDDAVYLYRFASDAPTSSRILGGAGNDFANIGAAAGAEDRITFDGGGGDDTLMMQAAARMQVSMGTGEDVVSLAMGPGKATISLGRGVDTIKFQPDAPLPDDYKVVTISDFAAGENGDRIDLSDWLASVAPGYVAGTDPFESGYLRLETLAGATGVAIDRDAGGDAFAPETLLRLEGVVASDLTAFNFGGFAPEAMMPIAQNLTPYMMADLQVALV